MDFTAIGPWIGRLALLWSAYAFSRVAWLAYGDTDAFIRRRFNVVEATRSQRAYTRVASGAFHLGPALIALVCLSFAPFMVAGLFVVGAMTGTVVVTRIAGYAIDGFDPTGKTALKNESITLIAVLAGIVAQR